jgi:trans-2,3-dihydro-3-hydroxyanthranilate isomerase
MQVDAFTDRPLGGNPCAIVFDADDLDDAIRLAIARENNLSETAFVVRSDIADFGARYFTPAEEIPLAGHPTIATVFALIDSGRLKSTSDLTTISLELKVGPIRVDIQSVAGVARHIIMSQKKPQFLATYDPAEIMPVFGLSTTCCPRCRFKPSARVRRS